MIQGSHDKAYMRFKPSTQLLARTRLLASQQLDGTPVRADSSAQVLDAEALIQAMHTCAITCCAVGAGLHSSSMIRAREQTSSGGHPCDR